MSEEILKALTQLFAIITKQDEGVTENERDFVIGFFQLELDRDSLAEYIELYDTFSEFNKQTEGGKVRLTSVKDSVKTLGICRKINKTLTQKQKVVVLIKLLELVGSDRNFTPQRMEIINTVSTVFNISIEEYKLIESFVVALDTQELNSPGLLIVSAEDNPLSQGPKSDHAHIEGQLLFMRVHSVDMYFVKYLGEQSNLLNGLMMQPGKVYLFSHGSTLKTQAGLALYFSDLVAHFNEEIKTAKLSFVANIEEFRFPNGAIGLRDIRISEGPGKLIGIMGASGAGKTTLLNVLAGLEKPAKGEILINSFNIHTQKDKLHGVIGYVSQDDLLIEELTVYQNLYYNARLCLSDFTEEQLQARVMSVLQNLGLDQRKDLRVGNALDKTISGGQRKRLNIALELIREPAVLFLDEPTSGLSSRDSENVIDLLKELSLKGKLVFVVIHQPSSDIYKMFDKMIIMDTGGYPVYYGAPVEAVTYFKKAAHQVDSNRGQCEVCGNVNPEQIFNIIEAKVVDEYGQPTPKRKVTPVQWNETFVQLFRLSEMDDVKDEPPNSLSIPSKLRQTAIFITRDVLAKISNKQYLLINLLEAPLLALILAFVIRYKSAPGGQEYLFRFNDNIPAFLLMSIIVALFMGLTVSAEEILRDRKILKRESFLNLSWNSYLLSKLAILFIMSAIQTLLFVVVGHLILEIHGMTLSFWFMLFTISCFANVMGLNISSAFNSAVTVYVLIPLLLIPQMILNGLLFNFDKLNEIISTKGKVPIVADLMASRWAYEGMAVYQFKNNPYEREFFDYERARSEADFKSTFLHDELMKHTQFLLENLSTQDEATRQSMQYSAYLIANTLRHETFREGLEGISFDAKSGIEKLSPEFPEKLVLYLGAYKKHYQKIYNENTDIQDKKMAFYESRGWNVNAYKNKYFNESVSDLVRNIKTSSRILEYKGSFVQQVDPVFQSPKPGHALDYRAGFFVHQKQWLGIVFDTYTFNALVIWFMSLVLYVLLYFEVFRKLVDSGGKLKLFGKR
jgi:ABC transport system ATP-binding/permease protein